MSDRTTWDDRDTTLVVEKVAARARLGELRRQLETEQERLQFLLESGKAISRILDLDELLGFAVELVLDFSGGNACAIFLKGKDGKLQPARVKSEKGRGELKVSRTIVQRALAERVALITRSATADDRFMHGESIVIGGIQSVMCAPLTAGEKVQGVLYVMSDRPTRQFDEGSLDALSAFASQLAVAIENARLFKLEEKLRIREREATLGRIAGEISHAIKNRLNSMMAPVEMLSLVVDERDEALKCAADINKGILALRDYVVNNLDYLRSGGGAGGERVTAMDEAVRQCVNVCAERFRREGVQVVTRFSDTLPRAAMEREKVEIILDNLLNNSAEAMRDSAEKRIMISVFWEPGEAYLTAQFSDSGCGIPKENLERIFDDYFTTKAEGTGIGLAQSRALLERCGGRIEARSEVGKGTTFLIILPVEKK